MSFRRTGKKLLETLTEGSLLGSGKPSIWADDLEHALNQQALARARRVYTGLPSTSSENAADVGRVIRDIHEEQISSSGLTDSVENVVEHAKKLWNRQDPFRDELAKRLGTSIESRPFLPSVSFRDGSISADIGSGARRFLGGSKDLLTSILMGSRPQRLHALDSFWKGGVMGPGSLLHQALKPGEAFGRNMRKYLDIMAGDAPAPGLKEMGRDAIDTVGALAKPLIIGGAAIPVYGVTRRLYLKPEDYNDSVPESIGNTLGWYAGTTLGLPFGIPGIQAGSTLGQETGAALGRSLNRFVDTYQRLAPQ